MTRLLRIAMVQGSPLIGSDSLVQLAEQVARIVEDHDGVDLVVMPEIHLCGDVNAADDDAAWLDAAAEPLSGPRVAALGRVAREHRIWLVPGTLPERDGAEVFNTAVVFSPAGDLVSSYRKVFPWRPSEHWTPGDRFVVFDIPDVGRLGLTICYDAWFPEATRSVAWLGAEVVLNLVKTVTSDRRQERVLAQANAITNQVFMISVNAAGPLGRGGSMVVDPSGVILADLPGNEPGVVVVDLDLDEVTRIREHGTEGVNRMWSQFTPDDPIIALPVYGGHIDPVAWSPRSPHQKEDR